MANLSSRKNKIKYEQAKVPRDDEEKDEGFSELPQDTHIVGDAVS